MVWGDGTWWTDSLIWSLMFRDGPKWSEISEMVPCGQRWSWMVKHGLIFSEMVTGGPRWDNPTWSDDPETLWVHFKHTLGTLCCCAHSEHTMNTFIDHSNNALKAYFAHSGNTLGTLWTHSGYTLSTPWAHSGIVLYWALRVPYTLRQPQNLTDCLVQPR